MNRTRKGAVAGIAAGVTWKAVEPLLQRAFHSPYSDPGVPAGFLAQGRLRLPLEYAVQACGGAVFGAAFGRLGGAGVRRGVVCALAEDAALWPAVAIVQRRHPDVRAGRWPEPFADPGSIAVSFAGHAVFGAVLGALLRRSRPDGK